MIRCGASTAAIDGLLHEIRQGRSVSVALKLPAIPECARRFVRQTFDIIEGENLCAIASAFSFGREDLLPAVFQRIVDELDGEAGGGLEGFVYYLDRHIRLDGEEHGPMANRHLLSLGGSDESPWQVAEQATVDCPEARRALWDGICDVMRRDKVSGLAPESPDG